MSEVRSFGRWKKRERSPSERAGSTEADRRVVKRTVPRGGVGRKPGDHPGSRRDASARSRCSWEAEVGQTYPASRPTGSRKANRTVSDRRTRLRAPEGRAVERLRVPRARPSRKETVATLTRATAGRRRNRCAGLAWHLLPDDTRRLGPRAKVRGHVTRRKAFWVDARCLLHRRRERRPWPSRSTRAVLSSQNEAPGRNDSCRSAGADNRRCLRGDRERQRSERQRSRLLQP